MQQGFSLTLNDFILSFLLNADHEIRLSAIPNGHTQYNTAILYSELVELGNIPCMLDWL